MKFLKATSLYIWSHLFSFLFWVGFLSSHLNYKFSLCKNYILFFVFFPEIQEEEHVSKVSSCEIEWGRGWLKYPGSIAPHAYEFYVHFANIAQFCSLSGWFPHPKYNSSPSNPHLLLMFRIQIVSHIFIPHLSKMYTSLGEVTLI